MAKVQKTFLIDEDLAQLIDKVLELSGMNFTRFATGALLQALFDRCTHPEIGPLLGPDALWTSLAVRLEHGAVTVGSIPTELLKDAIHLAKYPLNDPTRYRDGDRAEKADFIAKQKSLVRARESAMEVWQATVKDNKGELPAALVRIEDCFRRR